MILITGTDPVVDATCAALDGSGRAYRRVEKLDADGAWGAGATTVVLVEPLPRAGATASASGHGLREIISAASAPGVRSAILVTPRPDADAELRAVRRSGIPYTIVRPLPLLERAAAPVLIARELASAPAAAVTTEMIVDAVIAVIDGGACGQTRDVVPPAEVTWAELLARAGATPKPVARWRARVGRWFGARTLDLPALDGAAAGA